MKRIIAYILICTLLLAGVSMPVQAQEIDGLVEVSTVDQLLDAIAPGAIIQLLPGDYCLQDAASYGGSGNEYYTWVDCYDGYELQITGVDGLTVLGGENVRLLAAPRYANVLFFRNCKNVEINGITAGHSPKPGSCCGGVVALENCEGIKLENCVLFGCGVTALIAYDSDRIAVTRSTLTDCSYSGAELYRCEDVFFNECTFSENAVGEEYAGSLIYVDSSRYVTMMNCGITGNATEYLLSGSASYEVSMLGCTCADNSFGVGYFYLEAVDVTVTNCSFAGMNAGNAFAAAYNPGRVLDQNGNVLSYDALLLMKTVPAQTRPERTQQASPARISGGSRQHYYEADTADELLAAIGSHRVICLTADIDLDTATGYGTGYTESWRWDSGYTGAELVITNVKDLTITVKYPGITLRTSPREAAVLSFENCRDINVEGLTAGHTEMPEYSCTGAVLVFRNSRDIEIEDCALYGCGTLGVEAYFCRGIEIEDTEIYDCSLGGLYFVSCNEIEIENCSIHDCAWPALFFADDCSDIEVNGKYCTPGNYDIL